MTGRRAHHLAEQQIGQVAAPAATPHHQQVGPSLERLGHNLPGKLRPRPDGPGQFDPLGARRFPKRIEPRCGLGHGPVAQQGGHALVLRIADDRQHHAQPDSQAGRQVDRDALGAGVEGRALGCQKNVAEGSGHGGARRI